MSVQRRTWSLNRKEVVWSSCCSTSFPRPDSRRLATDADEKVLRLMKDAEKMFFLCAVRLSWSRYLHFKINPSTVLSSPAAANSSSVKRNELWDRLWVRIHPVEPPLLGGGRTHLSHLKEPWNWNRLVASLWRNQLLNAASEGCNPPIETQLVSVFYKDISMNQLLLMLHP